MQAKHPFKNNLQLANGFFFTQYNQKHTAKLLAIA